MLNLFAVKSRSLLRLKQDVDSGALGSYVLVLVIVPAVLRVATSRIKISRYAYQFWL